MMFILVQWHCVRHKMVLGVWQVALDRIGPYHLLDLVWMYHMGQLCPAV